MYFIALLLADHSHSELCPMLLPCGCVIVSEAKGIVSVIIGDRWEIAGSWWSDSTYKL